MITIAFIEQINFFLGLGGIATILFTVILLYDFRTKRLLSSYVMKWGMYGALLLTVAATGLTLVYSEIFGLIPCGLCWLERMALYPQVILIGVALYYKEKSMPLYGIALSIFGFVVSLYHHYIQMGGSAFVRCPAAGADCAKRFMLEFGFITFPLLATMLFAFLIVLYIYILKVQEN